jgi:nucleoside-diphosphate-sugar epimerase
VARKRPRAYRFLSARRIERMRILLAGATGVLGRNVIPLLIRAGHHVIGTSRHEERFAAIIRNGAEPIRLDALDKAQTEDVLASARPDLVMHQLTDLSDRNFAGNATLRRIGTRNLVDAALAHGVRHMIAQSISWIHAPGPGPAREDDPWDLDAAPPRLNTILSVKELEQAVAEMPHGVVLRYGALYGPGTWYARDGLISTQMRQGELQACNDITSFVHVSDAAQATLQALRWPAGLYSIVDDTPAAADEWMPLYARLIGATEPPTALSMTPWARGSSNERARSQGWQPHYASWRLGFPDVLAVRS